jgi:hypothetical protein
LFEGTAEVNTIIPNFGHPTACSRGHELVYGRLKTKRKASAVKGLAKAEL